MARRLVLLLALAACGGRAAPAPTAAPPVATEPAPDAAPPLDDCANACTEIAVCYEEVYERDYTQGGNCTVACEGQPPEERQAFFTCVQQARDCPKMVEC